MNITPIRNLSMSVQQNKDNYYDNDYNDNGNDYNDKDNIMTMITMIKINIMTMITMIMTRINSQGVQCDPEQNLGGKRPPLHLPSVPGQSLKN